MNKLQKIEFLIIALFLIIFYFFMGETFKNMTFFGESSVSDIWYLLGICLLILIIFFLVVYIIKLVKEKDKSIKLLLGIFPFVAIGCSIFFQNELYVLWIVMAIFYNKFLLNYYGKNKKMILSTFIYNIVVIYYAINGTGINYIHHYYLGFLLIAILFGYIELFIRTKFLIKCKKSKK